MKVEEGRQHLYNFGNLLYHMQVKPTCKIS